jgi:tetratricopeptide (TPR) repeat protein
MKAEEAHRRELEIDAALATGDTARAEAMASAYLDAAGSNHRDPPLSLGHDPWFRARFVGANVALQAGRAARAESLLRELDSRLGELPRQLLRRVCLNGAEASVRLGNHDLSRRWLARLAPVDAARDDPRLAFQELRVQLMLGDVSPQDDLVAEFQRALTRSGDLVTLALLEADLARAWEAIGNSPRALNSLKRVVTLRADVVGPESVLADVNLQLGRLAHARGDWQEALDHFEEARRRSGDGSIQGLESQLRRSLVLAGIGRTEAALALWGDVVEGLSSSPPDELLGLIAAVAAVLGVEGATAGVGAEPETEGFRLALRGEIATARACYTRAWEAETDTARRARQALALGRLALLAGDRGESVHWLTLAMQLADADALMEVQWRSRDGLGEAAAWFEGDEAAARAWFEQALVIAEQAAPRLRDPIHRAAYRQGRVEVSKRLLLASARRGDVPRVFQLFELTRGRFLVELWRQATEHDRGDSISGNRELDELDKAIDDHDGSDLANLADLISRRNRLLDREHPTRDRSQSNRSSRMVTSPPTLDGLARALPRDCSFVSATLAGDALVVLTVLSEGLASVEIWSEGARVRDQMAHWRQTLAAQLRRYEHGLPMGAGERREIDELLDDIGHGPLGRAMRPALESSRRLFWVPDGVLHGLPASAFRIGNRYLVETHEFVQAFSGSMIVEASRRRAGLFERWCRRKAVVLAGSHDGALQFAPVEGDGVADAWRCGQVRRINASCPELRPVLRRELGRAKVVHLACHAEAEPGRPFASSLILPSAERLRAMDWLDEPVQGLPLLVLSACRSAEVGSVAGSEVFGLTCGALAAGVNAVISGLWPLADYEVMPLIWSFYGYRMTQDLALALASAQREVLRRPGQEGSPLFWASLALHGDPNALPATPRWRAGINLRRSRRYALRCRERLARIDGGRPDLAGDRRSPEEDAELRGTDRSL